MDSWKGLGYLLGMRNCHEYLTFKKQFNQQEFTPRKNCSICGFAKRTCYCHMLKPFDSKIIFVILIHKLEIDRKIATGRMSHLILKNSYLLPGHDYTNNETLNSLIIDPTNHCMVLYPGENSANLSIFTDEEKKAIVPEGKQLVVIVIDGTWATSRQSMRMSTNLATLPQISFTVNSPSNFRIRKQPAFECCSTVEAIHRTIDLLGDSQGFNVELRAHDNLLQVFDFMVSNQLSIMEQSLM